MRIDATRRDATGLDGRARMAAIPLHFDSTNYGVDDIALHEIFPMAYGFFDVDSPLYIGIRYLGFVNCPIELQSGN